MPSYDSDSSGDEGSEYTETNVLLGYASKEPTDDNFSQLGGRPSWIDNTAPSFALAKCAVCNSPMPLLLQLNGDMPHNFPGHSRRLYIFACRRKPCARKPGSIRALRATKVDAALAAQERVRAEEEAAKAAARQKDEAERRAKQGTLGSALFGGPTPGEAAGKPNPFSANPFAAASSSTTGSANPFASPASGLAAKPPQAPTKSDASESSSTQLAATFAQKARIAAESSPATPTQPAPHEPWPTDATLLATPYPSYHLDADYETLAPDDPAALPANAQLDPDAPDPDDGKAGTTSKEEKEIYESLMDRAFQRFADRLAQNPEQVLRYEWRGEPVLYSRKDAVGALFGVEEDEEEDEGAKKVRTAGRKGLPRCAGCGAERVFEVQLTPQAIAELEAEEVGLEGMEWGTVIVGVCGKDCGPAGVKDGQVGYLEEWVGVQWEEVAERRK
ncbi:hypothetical protein GTA08_BOTSDO06410 [Botryosphaeria dothidea]|uniref:Programmed cell death protein 2 C-terminal domain-containing protein n=1 Tax=Botryosphaeria dothidea TaxID=55169 RepID=A0A8H4IQZ6_9PEZI|nr:hypothetical protein GTA08_BOTSDO06410 [Botryosphaeria dothidea]